MCTGEYGGPSPYFTGPTIADQAFPAAALDYQVEDAKSGGAFGISTIWAWMGATHRKDMVQIWPGSKVSSPHLLYKVKYAMGG